MDKNYQKFRDMLPPVAGVLDLSKAAGKDADIVKNMGYENEFDGAYAGNLFLHMNDDEINETVEEIFDALEAGGLLYAKFREEAKVGEFINEDAGFDVIEVLDDGVICKKIADNSINIFKMMY